MACPADSSKLGISIQMQEVTHIKVIWNDVTRISWPLWIRQFYQCHFFFKPWTVFVKFFWNSVLKCWQFFVFSNYFICFSNYCQNGSNVVSCPFCMPLPLLRCILCLSLWGMLRKANILKAPDARVPVRWAQKIQLGAFQSFQIFYVNCNILMSCVVTCITSYNIS